MSLNPNTPTIVGCEWMPLRQRGLPIDTNRRQAALFTPGAVTTDDVAVYLKSVIGAPVIAAELYKVSDINAAAAVAVTGTYRPTADQGITNAAHANLGTTPPFYVDVNGSTLNTAVYMTNTAATGSWGFNVGSSGFSGRVLSVSAHFVANTVVGSQSLFAPWLNIGGVHYNPSASITVPNAQPAQWDVLYTTNPATGIGWTATDVAAFASGSFFGIDLNATVNGLRLYQAWLTVQYVVETRLALGSATPTAEVWLTIPMATPGGTSTWTPAAATQYALILSTATGGASCSWSALDSGVNHPDYTSAPVTTTGGYPTSLGTIDTAAPAFVALDSTGLPIYGQPYATLIEAEANLNQGVQQEVTLPDTQSRGWLRFVARLSSTATTAPLVGRLKRRSDNVQIGGDVTVNPFDVRNEPRLMQQISMAAASGAAGTAVQHYIDWSCAGASGLGWLLTTMATGEPGAQKLTTNQQGVETDTTGFSAGANTTIARSTSQAHAGAASLAVNATSGTNVLLSATLTGAGTGGLYSCSVLVGAMYTLSVWVLDNGTHTTAELRYSFYTSGNAPIGSATVLQSATTTGAWQQLTGSVIAPATAANLLLEIRINTAATSTPIWYFDDFSLLEAKYGILGVGANTDQATIAGVKTIGRDVAALVGVTRTPPAGLSVVQT